MYNPVANKAWREANKEKCKAYSQKYLAKKRAAKAVEVVVPAAPAVSDTVAS